MCTISSKPGMRPGMSTGIQILARCKAAGGFCEVISMLNFGMPSKHKKQQE